MIHVRENKLENVNGLNRSLAENFIVDIYRRYNKSRFEGIKYIVIIRKNKEFGFSGVLISKITRKKYKFRYSYISDTFIIN